MFLIYLNEKKSCQLPINCSSVACVCVVIVLVWPETCLRKRKSGVRVTLDSLDRTG